ncbi:MAG: transporter suffix domain-containing protein [Bacteroidales bacterium]
MSRRLGLSLIILSWILWGVIFVLPFCKLTLNQYAIFYPVLLVSTNIFWIGAALVGREIVQKFNVLTKVKIWLKNCRMKNDP